MEGSGEDADEEFDCRESCSECGQNHAYGASRRVCQFVGERGTSWPWEGFVVGHDREVVQPDIGAGEGDRRTHSGQRGMAIDCLERGKAGERDGIVEAIESTEPEPLCLCSTGGRKGFF